MILVMENIHRKYVQNYLQNMDDDVMSVNSSYRHQWSYNNLLFLYKHTQPWRKNEPKLTRLETLTLILKTDDRDENLFMSDGWGLVVMVKSSWSAGSEEWDWLSGAQTKHRLESWSARLSLILWTSRSWMAIWGEAVLSQLK